MANALYNKGREGFLDGTIDWDTNDIRVILIDTADYTFSQTHDNLDDVASASRVATSGALTGKTVLNGVADADNVTFTAVTGDPCEAIIIYKHTGVETTARLIAYIDTASSGLPVTPNGGDITIAWANSGLDGAGGIFKL